MGCDVGGGERVCVALYFNPRIPYGMRLYRSSMAAQLGTISIHASRMGCDWRCMFCHLSSSLISIHASRMGCDSSAASTSSNRIYFNPRIPYGMRLALTVPRGYFSKFQSTHPVWDATTSLRIAIRGQAFQSTHPVWDATTKAKPSYIKSLISIHASRMGCDLLTLPIHVRQLISIHASRMGCDTTLIAGGLEIRDFNPRIPYGMRLFFSPLPASLWTFQSTHPVWDATWTMPYSTPPRRYFNPRIPYGMRHALADHLTDLIAISIHASRMGCDCALTSGVLAGVISIHASRMGCDCP